MNNKTRKILYSVLTFLNLGILIALFVLNKLSETKMGVMRYLVSTRYNFPKTYFTEGLSNIYKGILVILIALIIFLLIKKIKNKSYTKSFITNSIISIIFCILGISIYYIPSMQELLIYYFLIIGLLFMSIFEFLKLLLIIQNSNIKQSN